jgi:glycosyltransferase involved in cell wall biosynthesis
VDESDSPAPHALDAMKLACVVHRYGPQAVGGSEAHCRAIARRLAAHHDVTVLTSCATDYVTWRNVLPPGDSRDDGVLVRRFAVDRPRHLNRFRELSERVFAERAGDAEQREWFEANGPSLPGLLDHLTRDGAAYDRVLFWAFRYAPTWFGLPLVAGRAILVPTAEDDELIRTSTLVGAFFGRPRAYGFLTPEERALVASHSAAPLPPSEIIGAGLDPVAGAPHPNPLPASGERGKDVVPASGARGKAVVPASGARVDTPAIAGDFVLYLGRVDRNKGCDRLFDAWTSAEADSLPTLVLAGPIVLTPPPHPRIRALGYVDDATREALLSTALALVMPSPYESLSLVVLEAWNHRTPVIVNGRCAPLRGQVQRANGGLFYDLPAELVEGVRYLREHRTAARAMGASGLAYVEREYRWPVVMERVERLLRV